MARKLSSSSPGQGPLYFTHSAAILTHLRPRIQALSTHPFLADPRKPTGWDSSISRLGLLWLSSPSCLSHHPSKEQIARPFPPTPLPPPCPHPCHQWVPLRKAPGSGVSLPINLRIQKEECRLCHCNATDLFKHLGWWRFSRVGGVRTSER